MTDLSSSPLPAATRRAIAAGVAVLAILTVLGTAPQPGSSAAGDDLALTPMVPMTVESGAVGQGGQTFAQLFDEMRAPEVGGEGQGTVVVAAPPSIPEVEPESQPQPVATGAAAVATRLGTELPRVFNRGGALRQYKCYTVEFRFTVTQHVLDHMTAADEQAFRAIRLGGRAAGALVRVPPAPRTVVSPRNSEPTRKASTPPACAHRCA